MGSSSGIRIAATARAFRGCIGAIVMLAIGCSATARVPGSRAAADPSLEGDPAAPPSLRVLPGFATGASADTPRTHQAILLAREAFDTRLSAPPAGRSFAELKEWADTTVVAWLDQRRAQTQAAADRFALEGPPNAGERAVSHALVALLDEDTGRVLADLPAPSELDAEPEIAAMYRDVMRAQAESFVNGALGELQKCAKAAAEADVMDAWARFCQARSERVRAELAPAKPSGTVASNTH